MHRIASPLLAAAFLVNGPLAQAQASIAADNTLKFDVASLKPSAPGGRGGQIRPHPGGQRYAANHVSLKTMNKYSWIPRAYPHYQPKPAYTFIKQFLTSNSPQREDSAAPPRLAHSLA
jgi:hypothetical protein